MTPSVLCLLDPEAWARLGRALPEPSALCDFTWVASREAFARALDGGWGYDLALAGDPMPEADQNLALVRERCPDLPFLVLSEGLEPAREEAYLAQGATDCLTWDRLAPGLRRALREARRGAALREAQAQNRQWGALLRAALESTAEGLLVVDLAGRVAAYNDQFLALCNLPPSVMAPMDLDRVLRYLQEQFDSPEAFLDAAAVLGARKAPEASGLMRSPNGQVLEAQVLPFLAEGARGGSVFSVHDVTGRERRVDLLKGEVAQLRNLLDAAALALVVPWRLAGDALRLADTAEGILEPGPEGLPTDLQGLEARVHPEDLDRFRQGLAQGEGSFEARLRRGAGTWIWTRWAVALLPDGDRAGTFRDFDQERLQEERALRRVEDETLATLAQGAARTLAQESRKLGSRLALLESSRPLTEAQLRHLAAARSAQAGLDALLAFMAGPAPAWGPHPALALNAFLEGLRPRLEAILPQGVLLRFELAPDLPALACSSADLEQVVLELAGNARDALGDAGALCLRTGQPASGGVFLEVEDDGPGLEEPGRAFEPFYTTKPGARGLGLWVARTLVERYGGTLEMRRTRSGGTVMRVSILA